MTSRTTANLQRSNMATRHLRVLIVVASLLAGMLTFPQGADAGTHQASTIEPFDPCSLTHTYGSYYFNGATLYQSTLSGTDSDCSLISVGINNNNPTDGDGFGPQWYASVSTASATTYDALVCHHVNGCKSHYDL